MGVDVHEARSDDLARRVDGFGRVALQCRIAGPPSTNLDDLAVLDADVGREPVRTRSVDDGPACDLEVEHDYSLECRASR